MKRIAVICFPGPSLEEYNDSLIPESWIRIIINNAIEKVPDPDCLVVTGSKYLPGRHMKQLVCATHSAPQKVPDARYVTAENAFEAAIKVLKRRRITEAYLFGFDCCAERRRYYFDYSKPYRLADKRIPKGRRVKGAKMSLFITPSLKAVIKSIPNVLKRNKTERLKLFCMSERSCQNIIKYMPPEAFQEIVADYAAREQEALV
jgi:hypothetical protein